MRKKTAFFYVTIASINGITSEAVQSRISETHGRHQDFWGRGQWSIGDTTEGMGAAKENCCNRADFNGGKLYL